MLLSDSSRAQKKNTLYLWVDTVYIGPTAVDVTLDVKFKLDLQRSPVKFTGYNAEIDYGPSAYVTVSGGGSGVLTENTASRFITDPMVSVFPDHVKVVAFGEVPLDTTYSTLFRIRMSAFLPNGDFGLPEGGRAYFSWDFIQVVDDSGIDTVVYGGGFVERRKQAPEPTFDTVRITLPSVVEADDSTFDVPVIFDTISGSKIKHFAFSFDYDSSVVRFDDAILASDIAGTISKDIQPSHADVFLISKDSSLFFGADTLFYLRFTSRPRIDTVCTSLGQVGFLPVNSDAKVDARIITVGEICVQGFNPGPDKVREYEGFSELSVFPNPASEVVAISLPEQKGRFLVSVFDASGRTVHSAEGIGRVEWRPIATAKGAYSLVVTLDGHSVLRHVIIR
jgi:hypothetical protein